MLDFQNIKILAICKSDKFWNPEKKKKKVWCGLLAGSKPGAVVYLLSSPYSKKSLQLKAV